MQTEDIIQFDNVIENSGTLNINGGTLISTSVSQSRAIYNLSSGTVNMTQGTLVSQNKDSWTVLNLGNFNFNGGTIRLIR